MSAWALKFKQRMMQLEIAVKDFETGKIYTVNDKTPVEWGVRPIHRDLYDQMNYDRRKNGLKVYDLPYEITFDDWEGRGFQHKFTKEFMQADKASDWASIGGYGNEQNHWDGESLKLRRIQDRMNLETV